MGGLTETVTDVPPVLFPGAGDVSSNAWNDIELPDDDSAWKETVEGRPFDLSLLWEVLEKHKEHMDEKEEAGKHINTTWELVVIQVNLATPDLVNQEISQNYRHICKLSRKPRI